MKNVKVLLGIVVIIGILAGAVWQFYLKNQMEYARIATAYGAKQVCSCRFIGEREMQSCRQDFTDNISALTITQHDETITATAPLGLAKGSARYTPELGCSLVK